MGKYEHILSPIAIGTGGKSLRNRLCLSKCGLGHSDVERHTEFYIRMAENGAALLNVWMGKYPGRELDTRGLNGGGEADGAGPDLLDMTDPAVRAGFVEMNRRIHALGSLTSASMMDIEPMDVGIADIPNWDEIPRTGDYNSAVDRPLPGISTERLEGLIDEFVYRARDFYSLGFDMVTFYMSYRASILANSLSPCYNQRTDRFGGTTNAERARLCAEVFRRVKEACPGLLIEAQISGEEEAPGYTADDWLEYCRIWEGLVDMYQVRGYDGSSTHVNGHNMQPHCPPNLRFAEMFKKAGIRALVSPVGGFGDPDDIERFLAEGRTDLVSIARQFIADPEYGRKLEEGRGEDVVPCLLCNRCHGKHRCAVDPASLNRDKQYAASPTRSKRVAVLGGGIAGIQAALTAAARGHRVELYEKSGRLGGQLLFADHAKAKWPIRKYRDHMIARLERSAVTVHRNAEADPDHIRQQHYDAIICALGSEPAPCTLTGIENTKSWNAEEVYGREDELGPRVVVIGGGTTGRETAVHLAECGHSVTLICRKQAILFSDLHSQRVEEDSARRDPNFHFIEHASVQQIGENWLRCEVKRGIPPIPLGFSGYRVSGYIHQLEGSDFPPEAPAYDESRAYTETLEIGFDSLVVSMGRRSRRDLAERFCDCAPEVYIVGDNASPCDIKQCNAEGYDAAMRL